MSKKLIACKDCKWLGRELYIEQREYGPTHSRRPACLHPSCFRQGEFHPISGKHLEVRIRDYNTKNATGQCPTFEEK